MFDLESIVNLGMTFYLRVTSDLAVAFDLDVTLDLKVGQGQARSCQGQVMRPRPNIFPLQFKATLI